MCSIVCLLQSLALLQCRNAGCAGTMGTRARELYGARTLTVTVMPWGPRLRARLAAAARVFDRAAASGNNSAAGGSHAIYPLRSRGIIAKRVPLDH